jgi:hypothetical protein
MKPDRGSFHMLQHEQVMQEVREDSYRQPKKYPDPSVCPTCGASNFAGLWTWRSAPADSVRHVCPACHRIADRMPAGYLTFQGPFAADHRDEILAIVRSREAVQKQEHPLQRVMGVEHHADGILVTTTDNHLAHRIARAVQRAYKGELEFHYNKGENLLRATWTR